MVDKWLINSLAAMVTFIWSASMITDIVKAAYDPSPFLHGAMMLVLGAVFGVKVVREGKGNGRE